MPAISVPRLSLDYVLFAVLLRRSSGGVHELVRRQEHELHRVQHSSLLALLVLKFVCLFVVLAKCSGIGRLGMVHFTPLVEEHCPLYQTLV